MSTTQERFGDDFGGERMWGLKELPLPDPVSMTPQTIGWLVVALVAIAFAGWLLWRWRRRWAANAYRRLASAALDEMAAEPAKVRELPFVLRRTALEAYDRSLVASVRGKDWIDWLNDSAGRSLFPDDAAETFELLAYGSEEVEADRARKLIGPGQMWVRHHRV